MTNTSRAAALAITLGLLSPLATIAAPAAEAAIPAKHYSNCDALHRDFKHGVARSRKAANKAVRDGYGRPSTTRRAKAVYAENKGSLDRDKDGTACEA